MLQAPPVLLSSFSNTSSSRKTIFCLYFGVSYKLSYLEYYLSKECDCTIIHRRLSFSRCVFL